MIPKKDLKIEFMRGRGPGGQHRNKTDSACRITHIPTGTSAYCDERKQGTSKRNAMKELENKLANLKSEKVAEKKKEARDYAIHNTKTIRTYDFKKQTVIDHRTGKTARLKEVLFKGRIDLLGKPKDNNEG